MALKVLLKFIEIIDNNDKDCQEIIGLIYL
jgi:hypothetical protein